MSRSSDTRSHRILQAHHVTAYPTCYTKVSVVMLVQEQEASPALPCQYTDIACVCCPCKQPCR